jgi:hypothetical protein
LHSLSASFFAAAMDVHQFLKGMDWLTQVPKAFLLKLKIESWTFHQCLGDALCCFHANSSVLWFHTESGDPTQFNLLILLCLPSKEGTASAEHCSDTLLSEVTEQKKENSALLLFSIEGQYFVVDHQAMESIDIPKKPERNTFGCESIRKLKEPPSAILSFLDIQMRFWCKKTDFVDNDGKSDVINGDEEYTQKSTQKLVDTVNAICTYLAPDTSFSTNRESYDGKFSGLIKDVDYHLFIKEKMEAWISISSISDEVLSTSLTTDEICSQFLSTSRNISITNTQNIFSYSYKEMNDGHQHVDIKKNRNNNEENRENFKIIGDLFANSSSSESTSTSTPTSTKSAFIDSQVYDHCDESYLKKIQNSKRKLNQCLDNLYLENSESDSNMSQKIGKEMDKEIDEHRKTLENYSCLQVLPHF